MTVDFLSALHEIISSVLVKHITGTFTTSCRLSGANQTLMLLIKR